MKLSKFFLHPIWLLVIFCMLAYYPFFLQGKVPFPGDVVVGAYYPWLDYKWGYVAGVPVKNSLLSDSFSQFLPWKYLGVEMITKGMWPLWNNYSYSGYPLLANYASSPFQPFNLLLLLPKYWGWGVYVFSQNLVAALGMFFYLRLFIKNPLARIAGSMVFAFSGLMTTWAEFGTGVYAAAMLPWIFGAVEYYWRSGKMRYLFLLTAAFTTLFLSGHAQLTTFSTVLLGGYVLVNKGNWGKRPPSLSASAGQRGIRWEMVIPMVFWGVAVLLSMLQLLPVFDNTQGSIRAAEAFSRSINFGLNPWYELIRLAAADFFGNPATNNYWSKVFYAEQSGFLGTLTLPLILPFVFKRFRTGVVGFWGVVALFCLFMAVDSPITQWFYALPLPFLTYSNASRIFFVSSMAVGVLVAHGVNLLEKDDYRRWVIRFLVWLGAMFIGVIGGIGLIRWWVRAYSEISEVAVVLGNLQVTMKNLVLPGGVVLGGLGSLGLLGRFGKRRQWMIGALVLLVVFDLSRYFLKLNPFVPQQFVFPNTPVIDFLQTQPGLYRVSRADKETFPPNTWIPYKLQFVEGYDPLVSEDYARFFKVLDNQGYNSGIDRFSELNNYPSKFLDAMNVKYFLAVKRSPTAEIGKGEELNYRLKETNYKKVFEDKATVVLENPNAKDRAYFVSGVISSRNKAELAQKLQDKQFDPTKQALIVSSELSQNNLPSGEVVVSSYEPNQVLMNVKTPGKGFVVVADSYDKGWNLLVDGKDQTLYQVNGAVRGFWVEPGGHQVKMYYFPDAFDLGLKLSGLGILGLLGLLGISLWKKQL